MPISWGDLKRSCYFQVDGAPGVEQVIRALSVRTGGGVLGRAFQGGAAVRVITPGGHQLLATFAADLPLEPRARILPEERLEAAILLGDKAGVERLAAEERPGLAEERRAYLYGKAPTRSRQLIRRLREIYGGRCQVCEWSPRSTYGEELCEAHHLHWLSRGGEDGIENLVLVCPNHHHAVHVCDAPFDFSDMAFDFGGRRESLMLNEHLGA